MHKKKTNKKLKIHKSRLDYILLTIIVAAVVGIGIYLISPSKAFSPYASVEAENGNLTGGTTPVAQSGTSGGSYAKFANATVAGSICGSTTTPPTKWAHIVWIWDENKNETVVTGATAAPYITNMGKQCGIASAVLDNATTVALPSEPNYAAATSGSNCNVGITSSTTTGTGCITNDNDAQSLTTESIFQLVKAQGGTWKAYQEAMPSNCDQTSSGGYAFKHNPAAFYTQIRTDCNTNDVSFPTVTCSNTLNTPCTTPSGNFANDIANGNLPTFSFVTPTLTNDMHDGSVTQGDNWMNTYVPLIINSPNYKAGTTAIFIMTDEGSSNSGSAYDVPTTIIAPSIPKGTNVTTVTNNIGLLRTVEEMFGYSTFLGCSGGTPPGATTGCNSGSTVSVKSQFNL